MPYKTGSWGVQAQNRSKQRIEYFREYHRMRYRRNAEKIIKQNKNWQKEHREAMLAQYKARYHIEILEGQLCEECNEQLATDRHHPDYSKPLEVQVLCAGCHAKKR